MVYRRCCFEMRFPIGNFSGMLMITRFYYSWKTPNLGWNPVRWYLTVVRNLRVKRGPHKLICSFVPLILLLSMTSSSSTSVLTSIIIKLSCFPGSPIPLNFYCFLVIFLSAKPAWHLTLTPVCTSYRELLNYEHSPSLPNLICILIGGSDTLRPHLHLWNG